MKIVSVVDTVHRVETIEAGWNRLWEEDDYQTPRRDINDYGDGTAAQTIAALLKQGPKA